MGRVKLVFPAEVVFSTEIDIRITDLNYGAHVGNDTFLTIAHEARMRLLKKAGWEVEKRSDGFGIIMVDAVILFKSEVFYSDTLQVDLGIDDIHPYGFDLHYRMNSSKTGKEVAALKTGIFGFDYSIRKPTKLPEDFIAFLTNPN